MRSSGQIIVDMMDAGTTIPPIPTPAMMRRIQRVDRFVRVATAREPQPFPKSVRRYERSEKVELCYLQSSKSSSLSRVPYYDLVIPTEATTQYRLLQGWRSLPEFHEFQRRLGYGRTCCVSVVGFLMRCCGSTNHVERLRRPEHEDRKEICTRNEGNNQS